MEKESFILYNSFYEPIKTLNDEQLGKLFRSIFNYTINGEITKDNDILVAFMFIKNQLDMDNEKWQKEKEKRSEAGKKGMASRWGNKNNITNDNSVINSYNKNNSVINAITKITDNVNDNDNVNENVNDNDITNTSNIYEFFENNFCRTLSPIEYQKINDWLLLFSEDILKYAIEISVMNGKRTFNYVEGILKNWKGCNYTTIEEIKNSEQKEENNQKVIPYWYGQECKKEELTKEELEELEDMFKEFKGDE